MQRHPSRQLIVPVCLLVLAMILLASSVGAQVPVPGFANPGCESGGDPPTGWTEGGSGAIACSRNADTECGFPAAEGSQVFLAVSEDTGSITQTVRPSQGGGFPELTVTFAARVRDCFTESSDTGTLRIYFLDGLGNQLGSPVENIGFGAVAGSWSAREVEGVAPANTVQVRVEAVCNDVAGVALCDVVFDDMTLTTNAPLPVELATFEAVRDGAAVVLTWTTLSEADNAGFVVQRQAGAVWAELGFVEGHGTTRGPHSYLYRLRDLLPGRHVFRLKQVNLDGTAAYSPEVDVNIGLPDRFHLTEASPNPFVHRTKLLLSVATTQWVAVEAYDVLGRRVAMLFDGSLAADQPQTIVFEAESQPAGFYLIRVRGERFGVTRRVTLLR